MESKRIVEIHQVLTTKHQLVYGEFTLIEEKEELIITDQDSGKQLRQVVTTKKQIGDQSLVVTEEEDMQNEMTSLGAEELAEFKAKWSKYWNPCMVKETVKTALEAKKCE